MVRRRSLDSNGAAITRRQAFAALAAAAAGVVTVSRGAVSGGGDPQSVDAPAANAPLAVARRMSPPRPARAWQTESIGLTTQGRPINKWTSTALGTETRRILVVSAIHGNERVTRPIVERLSKVPLPDDVTVSIVPEANPDGWAANTRRNAQGVDLNRNFPWRWSPTDGGPSAASASETRALMAEVLQGQYDLAVWIHQPLAYVAPLPGCPHSYANAWRGEAGIPLRVGLDQHGGGETWCARVAGVPTMLVEVSSWAVSEATIQAHTRGFEECLKVVVPVDRS